VAKARLSLKSLNRSVNLLAKKVKRLRGKAASKDEEQGMAALHKKLTSIQKMMAGECPEHLFRSFELRAAGMRAKRKTATRAGATRKRTRKGR
jgi:hypothetical protein